MNDFERLLHSVRNDWERRPFDGEPRSYDEGKRPCVTEYMDEHAGFSLARLWNIIGSDETS